MTGEQVGGIVRTLLAALGGLAVGKGWLDNETATSLAGAAATIAIALWSIKSKKKPQA